MLGAFCVIIPSWVTLSQSRLGAQLDVIQEESRRNFSRSVPPLQRLGYRWDLPSEPASSSGLGGGISWAWDPTLCSHLLPRFHENLLVFEWINCAVLKAAVHSAFATWSDNHADLSFVDVTAECEAIGMLEPDCPLAEVWVTVLAPEARRLSDTDLFGPVNEALSSFGWQSERSLLRAGAAAATATPRARYNSEFRLTNGLPTGGGTAAPVVETYGGIIAFNTDADFCWYLDSTFCFRFHSLKSLASPSIILNVIRIVMYGLFLLALGAIAFSLADGLLPHLRRGEACNTLTRPQVLCPLLTSLSS